MASHEELTRRIERLERSNRRLLLLCAVSAIMPVLGIVGWQGAGQAQEVLQVLKVHSLEVVDARGVPLLTLNTGRDNAGGSITLRDSGGQKRGWWSSSPEGSNLALVKEKSSDQEAANTAGFGVTSNSADMNLIGSGNGMFSATVKDDKPHLDLWNAKGASVFAAPWKK
jgi:hypothetical protein